jgi:DNA repair protein RecO (recombination protein O)
VNWTDEAFVLSARPHGETSLLLHLLTREHGRHAGLARGARSSKARAALEPGAHVEATWQARLADHLGTVRCELVRSHAAPLIDDRLRLAALASSVALIDAALPEREPVPEIFDDTARLFAALEGESGWQTAYVRWELRLLGDLGFGLDLSRCAVTGTTENLTHVSPRTGRAVSAAAAAPYKGRLLALPAFLSGEAPALPADVAAGLALAGHFLDRHVFPERKAPAARSRLVTLLSREATTSSGTSL